MFVRVLNDNFKTFIQNQGHMKTVGFAAMICFVPFIPLCYYLICVKNLGAFGIGLSLLQYEGCSLIAMLYLFRTKVPEEYKNTNQSTLTNIHLYIWQAIRLTMLDWPSYISWDALNVVVGLTGDKAQLGAYSLIYNLLLMNFSIVYGLNVFTRTQVNYAIGQGDYPYYTAVFRKLHLQSIINSLLVCLLNIVFLLLVMKYHMVGNAQVEHWMKKCLFIVFCNCFSSSFIQFYKVTLKAFDYLTFLMVIYLLSDSTMLVLAYYLSVMKGLGVVGAVWAIFYCQIFKLSLWVTLIFGFMDHKEELEEAH